MLKNILALSGFVLILAVCSGPSPDNSDEKLTGYVNPFIGTGYHGHTYPCAAFPFVQIQLSPDNGTQGWDWCSCYHHSDSVIAGFRHLHLSGTGIGDPADISCLPVSNDVEFISGEMNGDFVARYAGKYSHDQINTEPGYYEVILKNNGIKADSTVRERAGLHRYSFPEAGKRNLIINLGFAISRNRPYKTEIRVADNCLTEHRLLGTK